MRTEFHISVQEDVISLIKCLTSIESNSILVGDYKVTLYFSDPWLAESFCSYERKFNNVNVLLVEEDYTVVHRKVKGVKYVYFTEFDVIEGTNK